jgi:DNA-binding MarR family transcriptional regulator
MKTLAGRLQVHPTSVTNAVDRLEAAGLVRRRPHPDDGRALLVELTEDGARQAREATAVLNAGVFTDPGVPARRVPTLVGLLRALRRSAGDF